MFDSIFDGKIWVAAKALTVAAYDEQMTFIKETEYNGTEAYEYLNTCREEWATAYFPIARFPDLVL